MSLKYTPTKSSERIVMIDALRGLAIFGILMVNLPLMHTPITQILLGAQPDVSLHQLLSESFIKVFFEGKFYVLFSMLFGYGFWIFINKTTHNGSGIVPVYRRRLFFLLLFGLAHVVLLWAGDILVFYALFGFLLILFKKVSNRKIIKWAIWLTLVPTLLTALMVAAFGLFYQIPEAKTAMDANMQQGVIDLQQFVQHATVIYSEGNYSEIVSTRLNEYTSLLPAIIFFYPIVLGMFLIGVWAARNEIFSNYAKYLPIYRKTLWWGLSIGIVTSSLYAIAYRYASMGIPDGWSLLATSMHTLSGISMGLFYISASVLILATQKSTWFQKVLAPVGRMALTNYLMQSIICAFLFHSYGLGLFGQVEVWQGIILTLLIFIAQIIFSRWWLSRFQYGPFEWVWRGLTYRKFQALRIKQ